VYVCGAAGLRTCLAPNQLGRLNPPFFPNFIPISTLHKHGEVPRLQIFAIYAARAGLRTEIRFIVLEQSAGLVVNIYVRPVPA
jgi:hypothetical protein